MLHLFWVLSYLLGFLGFIRKPLAEGRIIGGEHIDITEAPYQVSLLYNNKHICGGSLISKYNVLTAAHCTYGKRVSRFKVRIGSTRHAVGGAIVRVQRIHQHPLYNAKNMDCDIAILVLETYDSRGLSLGYVKIPKQDEDVPSGIRLKVCGWGLTQNPQESDLNLRAAFVLKINQKECNMYYKTDPLSDKMICAGDGGKDACDGDSGGPLVQSNNVQVGIVSWGVGCALPRNPGVYTRVSAFSDWITGAH